MQRHIEAIATLHEVTVFYVASSDHNHSPNIDDQVINGVRTIVVYCKRGMRAHVRAFQAGMKYVMQQHPTGFDLLHHHVAWPHIWQAVQWGKKWGIPIVLTEHWTGFDAARLHEMKFWQRAYLRRMLNRVDRICPVSQQLGNAMQAFGAKTKQTVIPNVVNTSIFKPDPTKHLRVKRMLHVSTLRDEHKNIHGLLRVWKRVTDIAPDWVLQIGGDGPMQTAQGWANEMGIPKQNIEWFGESSSEQIAEMMQRSDAFVLFSRYENLPCVILEAMACGLHIISTDVGGIREHVHASFGDLVKSEDEQALYDAIVGFIQREPHLNAQQAIYAANHFSIDSIARQYDAVYRDLGL
ncbi:MAG: glycosyltransferase family 4 protein [Flavobacteriales bacterium]